jgi:enterochelin esterase-like enzyme
MRRKGNQFICSFSVLSLILLASCGLFGPAQHSNEEWLKIIVQAIDDTNGQRPFAFNSHQTSQIDIDVTWGGAPASQSSENGEYNRDFTQAQDNSSQIIQSFRDEFRDSVQGINTSTNQNAEFRDIAGTIFVRGDTNETDPFAPRLPNGWVEIRGPATSRIFYGLSGFDLATWMTRPDHATLMVGRPPDQLESIFSKSLVDLSAEAATLADGVKVTAVTLTLSKQALRIFLTGFDLTDPINNFLFETYQGNPVAFTFWLDNKNHLVGFEQVINMQIAKTPLDALQDVPENSSIGASIVIKATLNLTDSELTAVEAPSQTEMGVLPAFSGTVPEGTTPPFATLSDLDLTLNLVANGGDPESLWQQVSYLQMPLIFGDTVIFLYRGDGSQVDWEADWGTSSGLRLGDSDIWMIALRLPTDARLEYRILLNGSERILDPLNPLVETGGLGDKSYFAMPDYTFSLYTDHRDDVAHGSLTDNLTISSSNLGYDVNYRIYTPAEYNLLENLPVIYITDGQDYLAFGHMQDILDNLIADGLIQPIIAVFIDPRDTQSGENLREQQFILNPAYGLFIADELVPVIDSAYKTNPSPDSRAILGASFGAYHSAYFALRHSDLFHLYGVQSPALSRDESILDDWRAADPLPIKVFMNTGTIGDVQTYAQALRDAMQGKVDDIQYIEVNEGHSYAQWRALLDDLLIYFFPVN